MSKKILIPKEMLGSSCDTLVSSDFLYVTGLFYENSGASTFTIRYTGDLTFKVYINNINTNIRVNMYNQVLALLEKEANSLNNQIQ